MGPATRSSDVTSAGALELEDGSDGSSAHAKQRSGMRGRLGHNGTIGYPIEVAHRHRLSDRSSSPKMTTRAHACSSWRRACRAGQVTSSSELACFQRQSRGRPAPKTHSRVGMRPDRRHRRTNRCFVRQLLRPRHAGSYRRGAQVRATGPSDAGPRGSCPAAVRGGGRRSPSGQGGWNRTRARHEPASSRLGP